MTKIRLSRILAALAISIPMMPGSAEAAGTAIRGKFSFDGIANCENPPVRNFPVHAEGTAELSTDRNARLDMNSNTEGSVQLNARLGDKPTEAPGGSASLHVAGKHTLRAIRDYPNNYIVVNLTVIGEILFDDDRKQAETRQAAVHLSYRRRHCLLLETPNHPGCMHPLLKDGLLDTKRRTHGACSIRRKTRHYS